MMTKKHFIRIAKIFRDMKLRDCTPIDAHLSSNERAYRSNQVDEEIDEFVVWFVEENPRFDVEKFRMAAMYGSMPHDTCTSFWHERAPKVLKLASWPD